MSTQQEPASFHDLTSLAHAILISDLERNGNILSDLHKDALQTLVSEMTGYAHGAITGRRAFSLGTGCGKTSAIIAWITALHRQGLTDVAVSISASKVEALCDLKQALLDHGVPESLIGLKHSFTADEASLPSTGSEDRRYQLVTHARVRGGNDDHLFVEHRGKPRALMIYDESLFRSEALTVSERGIRMELAALREYVSGLPLESQFAGLIGYLEEASAQVSARVEEQRQLPGTPLLLTLPMLEAVERKGYLSLLGRDQRWGTLRSLLGFVGLPLRTMLTKQDEGLVWYQISVPPELANILILDASYPIRGLVQLDQSISDATPAFVRNVKHYRKVTFHRMKLASGRESMSRNFGQQFPNERTVSCEVTKAVEAVPTEKAILIFTFKARSGGVDIPHILRRDLRNAGVDVSAKTADGKDRISILTWGDETSLNRYAHCEVVFLVGLLHLPYLDVASWIVGQRDSLSAATSNHEVAQMIDSEIAHAVYQAASRGSCRIVDNGEAKAMDVFLFYKGNRLEEAIKSVMPGVCWKEWSPTFATSDSHCQIDLQALQIKEYLDRQPKERIKVPTREIKAALGLEASKDKLRKMLERAIERVCQIGYWSRQGQSLIRYGALFNG